jgi:hypothetical protein
MNQKDKNLGKFIFVHVDMTFLTTLTGIFYFANLNFTGKKSSSNLEKNTAGYFKLENWKNQVQIDRSLGSLKKNLIFSSLFPFSEKKSKIKIANYFSLFFNFCRSSYQQSSKRNRFLLQV